MKNMKERKFEFYGVDSKTELSIALIAGLALIVVWFGLLLFYYEYFQLDSIVRISKRFFFLCLLIGFSVSVLFIKVLSHRYKNLWTIIALEDHLTITFKNEKWRLEKRDIQKISYLGNENFRYLSFFTNEQKIKIRVGTNFLTPFSTKEDLRLTDEFVEFISPFLKNNFDNKVKKAIHFENQGIYLKNIK
ncbi:hypothetical protein IO89_11560 [Epilithonimonas lactis]|uniref:Uncharacterized protein n=2 Tax=Epilithonimonas lactis TaxID=421072 RepID=A0A085BEH7_9FLAO|nr:hypothetical protein IO89_11560 [Epilithonimonas lactis]